MAATLNQVISQGLMERSRSWLSIYPKHIFNYGIANFYIPKVISTNKTVSPWVWVVGGAVAGGIISGILIAIEEQRATLERARALEIIRAQAEQQARTLAEQREEHRRRALADHWARAVAEQRAREFEEQRASDLVKEWTRAQQQVNAIKKFRQRSIYREECTICCDPLQAPFRTTQQIIDMLICGHTFHDACIKRWFRTSHECPVCRKNNASQKVRDVTKRCKRITKKRRQNCI